MELDVNKFREVELLFNRGLKSDEIREHLVQLGFKEESLEEQLQFSTQLKFRKQRKLGFKLLLMGAFLCLASCLLTFFHNYSEVYTLFTLYGITMVGACLLLAGLGLVLGF